jgi:hypothetical protein
MTAGGDIDALAALVVTSTGSVYESSCSSDTCNVYDIFKFIGFAANSATSTNDVLVATPGDVLCGFTSLYTGADYFINGAGGAIATSTVGLGAGDNGRTAKVAHAISDTCLSIDSPKYVMNKAITAVYDNTNTAVYYPVVTGFYPSNISVHATVQDPDPGYVAATHWSISEQSFPADASAMVLNTSSTGLWNIVPQKTLSWAVVTSTTDACGTNGAPQGNCGFIDTPSVNSNGFRFRQSPYSALNAILHVWIKN